MNNYELAQNRAREHFLSYGAEGLLFRPGVFREGDCITLPFLGAKTLVSLKTGLIRFSYETGESWEGDFSESLSVYDWLCDGKPDAKPAGEYTPIASMPGVLVSGQGLSIGDRTLASMAEENPEAFCRACTFLGGKPYPLGDMGFCLEIFPGLSLVLKFYHADEDFPPQLSLLWDKNTMDFVRYETMYYIAGVLFRRLRSVMKLSYISPEGLI